MYPYAHPRSVYVHPALCASMQQRRHTTYSHPHIPTCILHSHMHGVLCAALHGRHTYAGKSDKKGLIRAKKGCTSRAAKRQLHRDQSHHTRTARPIQFMPTPSHHTASYLISKLPFAVTQLEPKSPSPPLPCSRRAMRPIRDPIVLAMASSFLVRASFSLMRS